MIQLKEFTVKSQWLMDLIFLGVIEHEEREIAALTASFTHDRGSWSQESCLWKADESGYSGNLFLMLNNKKS
jgi:hypothetical protein